MSHSAQEKSLFDLITEADFDGLARRLEEGVNVSVVDDQGRTPAMWLAIKDHADLIDNLKDAGLDLDAQDPDGRTALMWAAELGHYDVVAALLMNDADVRLENKHGHSALWYAEWEDNAEIVALLKKRLDKLNEQGVNAAS